MAKHPNMNAAYNIVSTGGQFGSVYRLATFTIHYNEAVERFYVTDDQDRVQAHRVAGAGCMTIDDAVKAHKYQDDFRTLPR